MSVWTSPDVASTWLRAAEERNRMMAPATERMFALAGIREGAGVLDIGTGTGDTALMLAARVGPRGSVVATDVSPTMVSAAAEAARTAGVVNVTTRVMDCQSIDLADGSFDAAVARNALMFVADLLTALGCLHRVLRPGARFAAVTWAELERNPFNAIIIDGVKRNGRLPETTPELIRAFSLSDAGALSRSFSTAGFKGVVSERVPGLREFGSLDAALTPVRESPLYREVMAALSEPERQRALKDIETAYRGFVRPDGTCSFPMESLVTAGTA